MTSRTPERLFGPAQLANTATTIYTTPVATKTVVKNIHLENPPGGSSRNVTISIGTDAASKRIQDAYPIASGEIQDNWAYYVLEAGEILQAFCDTAATVVLTVDGDELTGIGTGSIQVYSKAFAFDTANLSDGTGLTVYTPTVDDVLLDAWVEIDTAWDGTTPLFDIGTGVTTDAGLFARNSFATVDMTKADVDAGADGFGGTGLLYGGGSGFPITWLLGASGAAGKRIAPLKFTAANPLKVWVTQDGARNGADPVASQGAAIVYLVIATPAAL